MTRIGDIADVFDGPHATPPKTENGPYFLSISSLSNGRLDLSKSARLSENSFVSWTKRVTPQAGDLLFSYETRLGEAALMPKGVRACLGRRMGLLRPNKSKVIPEFLLYSFLAPAFQNQIERNTITGATVNRIALNQLPDFEIRIPPIDQQVSISKLLNSIDHKIDLNKQSNAELEAMAKLIYDYWFVQFDFPDENGKPYKDSGGKMVWCEQLKREIPEGWETVSLGKVTRTILGGTPASNNPEYWEDGAIPWLSSGEVSEFPVVSSNEFVTEKGIHKSAAKVLAKGTTVISIVRHLRVSFLAIEAATNQSVVGICENETLKSPFLCLMLQRDIPRLMTLRTGAQQPHINKEEVDRVSFAKPPADILNGFYSIVQPFFGMIESNTLQNQELAHLRDWLLPKLMSGQVAVGE